MTDDPAPLYFPFADLSEPSQRLRLAIFYDLQDRWHGTESDGGEVEAANAWLEWIINGTVPNRGKVRTLKAVEKHDPA